MSELDDAEAWEWDEGNESELARHSVRPVEVEEIWSNGATAVPNKRDRPGDWKLVGWTNGGRALTIVVRHDSIRRTLRRSRVGTRRQASARSI